MSSQLRLRPSSALTAARQGPRYGETPTEFPSDQLGLAPAPPPCMRFWQPALINGGFIGRRISAGKCAELLIVLELFMGALSKITGRLFGVATRRSTIVWSLFNSSAVKPVFLCIPLSLFLSLTSFLSLPACPLGPELFPIESLWTLLHPGPGSKPVCCLILLSISPFFLPYLPLIL